MPQSDIYNIPWIIQLINRVKPNSILDIGIGNGTYGFLLRQSLDIGKGRLKKEQWTITIDGIEIFENYRNPIWDYFYNKVMIGNALLIQEQITYYDVILLGDIIEHFSKDDGIQLIDSLIRKAKYVIISTPKDDYPQGEVLGNIYETHLSKWVYSDFKNFLCKTIIVNTCNIYILCREKENSDLVDLAYFPHLSKPARQIRTLIQNIFSETIFDIHSFLEFRFRKPL